MDLFLPYIACLTFALALFAALRPTKLSVRILMIAICVAAVGWLFGLIIGSLSNFNNTSQGVFFVIFSTCSIAAAIRMITHSRPVYSALYFVLVVLSTAGLFLLLEAEFMAFALVIVYAGAILITYMFVLMLANQASGVDSESNPTYDSIPREPAAAVGVGFLLLCLVTGTVISGSSSLPPQGVEESQWATLEHLPKQLESSVMELDPAFSWPPIQSAQDSLLYYDGGEVFVVSSDGTKVVLPESFKPRNTQQVGWSLVNEFPVSLELAGVILLMAMFGAVILARRAIELGEEEKRNILLGSSESDEGGTA